MKIYYTKKSLNYKLILGLFMFIYGMYRLVAYDGLFWLDYGWLTLSLIYLGTYLYQKVYGYLKIENGKLQVNTLFKKTIKLDEIKEIRSFAGDYTLRAEDKEVKINTTLIDSESLAALNDKLKKTPIKWI